MMMLMLCQLDHIPSWASELLEQILMGQILANLINKYVATDKEKLICGVWGP